jgi:hypothetical protein
VIQLSSDSQRCRWTPLTSKARLALTFFMRYRPRIWVPVGDGKSRGTIPFNRSVSFKRKWSLWKGKCLHIFKKQTLKRKVTGEKQWNKIHNIHFICNNFVIWNMHFIAVFICANWQLSWKRVSFLEVLKIYHFRKTKTSPW